MTVTKHNSRCNSDAYNKTSFWGICDFMLVIAQQTGGYHAEMPISARSPLISTIIMKTRRNGPLGCSSLQAFGRLSEKTHTHTRIFKAFQYPISAYLSSSSTSSNIIWISSGVFPNVGSQCGSRASSAPPLCLDDFAPSVSQSTCLHKLDHLLPMQLLHCYRLPHWNRAWCVSCPVHRPICLLAVPAVCLVYPGAGRTPRTESICIKSVLFSGDMGDPVVVSDQRT